MFEYYYLIEDLINRANVDILYYQNGVGENMPKDAFDTDDRKQSLRWLNEIAAEMFVVLHKKGYGIVNSYVYNGGHGDETTGYIVYTINVPTNIDGNLLEPINIAIENALVAKLVYTFFAKTGKYPTELLERSNDTFQKVRSLINYKLDVRKTYRMY